MTHEQLLLILHRLQHVTSHPVHMLSMVSPQVEDVALEKPHDDNVVGERHSVVVELERVGVGECLKRK